MCPNTVDYIHEYYLHIALYLPAVPLSSFVKALITNCEVFVYSTVTVSAFIRAVIGEEEELSAGTKKNYSSELGCLHNVSYEFSSY